jgi:hypothetical protein
MKEFLAFKIRQMTDPNREKLRIPLAAKQKIVPSRVKKRIKELVSSR